MIRRALSVRRCLSFSLSAAVAAAVVLSSPAPSASPIDFPIVPEPPSIPLPRTFHLGATDGPFHRDDTARAVAASGTNTIYAAGFATTGTTGFGPDEHAWRIEKRRPTNVVFGDRTLVWRRDAGFVGEANAVAAARDGGVVAAGFSGTISVISVPTFMVAKWDANGVPLWQREVPGLDRNTNAPVGGAGEARAVAVTSRGDVLAVGYVTNRNYDGAQQAAADQDGLIVMLDGSTGAERWRRLVQGATFAGEDILNSLALDLNDNIYAVGSVRNISSNNDIVLASYDANGVRRFNPQLEVGGTSSGDDEALSVAVDALGQVYVAGSRSNFGSTGPQRDFWVGKCSGSGTWLFQRDLTGTVVNGEDRALSVGCDSAGNLYAAGFTTNTGSPGSPLAGVASKDFTVAKWDTLTGAPLWTTKLDGGANGDDRVRSLAVLPSGDLVAGGFLSSTGGAKDFEILRVSAAGVPGWGLRYDGTAHQDDICTAVAWDGSSFPIGVGVVRHTTTFADFAVGM